MALGLFFLFWLQFSLQRHTMSHPAKEEKRRKVWGGLPASNRTDQTNKQTERTTTKNSYREQRHLIIATSLLPPVRGRTWFFFLPIFLLFLWTVVTCSLPGFFFLFFLFLLLFCFISFYFLRSAAGIAGNGDRVGRGFSFLYTFIYLLFYFFSNKIQKNTKIPKGLALLKAFYSCTYYSLSLPIPLLKEGEREKRRGGEDPNGVLPPPFSGRGREGGMFLNGVVSSLSLHFYLRL